MPKPTLSSVINTADLLHTNDFEMSFPNMPVEGGDKLRLLCQSAEFPALTINPLETKLYGHNLIFAGDVTLGNELSITFVETRELVVFKSLREWVTMCTDPKTQHGKAYKIQGGNGYAREGIIKMFDKIGETIAVARFINIWPTTVPQISFAAEASVVTAAVPFKFDDIEIEYNATGIGAAAA